MERLKESRKDPAKPTRLVYRGSGNSDTRHRRLFNKIQDGILILDGSTGEITDVNPFFVKMLGYCREALLGKYSGKLTLFEMSRQAIFQSMKYKGRYWISAWRYWIFNFGFRGYQVAGFE
jgi:PAS domain-containing protein